MVVVEVHPAHEVDGRVVVRVEIHEQVLGGVVSDELWEFHCTRCGAFESSLTVDEAYELQRDHECVELAPCEADG